MSVPCLSDDSPLLFSSLLVSCVSGEWFRGAGEGKGGGACVVGIEGGDEGKKEGGRAFGNSRNIAREESLHDE